MSWSLNFGIANWKTKGSAPSGNYVVYLYDIPDPLLFGMFISSSGLLRFLLVIRPKNTHSWIINKYFITNSCCHNKMFDSLDDPLAVLNCVAWSGGRAVTSAYVRVTQPLGWLGRNQSSVRRLIWLWHAASMGPTALLPLRRKACWEFFPPKNPTVSDGFEPANSGTRGQHANP